MGHCNCRCSDLFNHMTEFDFFKMGNSILVDELVDIAEQKEMLEKKQRAIKNKLMEEMEKHHIESFETDSARVSYVEDSNYRSVDTAKLKRDYPSAYSHCSTYKYKNSYLIVRVKK